MKRFYISRLFIPIVLLLGSSIGAKAQTSFSTAGGPYTYSVPAGVTNLGVDVAGGNGGYGYSSSYNGGVGGRVQCNLAVSTGEVLYIYVGGAGGNGTGCCSTPSTGGTNGGGNSGDYYAGAGGGASDIRTNNTGATYTNATGLLSRVVVAGGGGGGSDYCGDKGGAGGGTTGGNGVECGSYNSSYSGAGGTQVGGGNGASIGVGGSGSFGSGEAGYCCYYAGGGGAGWYGGGGAYGGSGGGGSSYFGTGTSAVTNTQGGNPNTSGNGSVVIFGPGITASPSALAFGAVTTGTTGVPPSFFTIYGNAYMVSSSSIAGGITVTSPSPAFLLSTNGSTWSNTATVTWTSLAQIQAGVNVYVEFAPTASVAYSSNLSVTGPMLTTTTNIAVSGTGVTACNSAPSAGAVTIAPTTGSVATVFTMNLSPAPTAGGLTYQWQSAPTSAGPWSNVAGGVLPTLYYSGLSATTFFQCKVTCLSTGATTTYVGTSIGVSGLSNSSCTPSNYNGTISTIYCGQAAYPVTIVGAGTTLSDPTAPYTGVNTSHGYNDETSTSYTVTMSPGQSYAATIGPSISAGTYASVQVWIDFNNSGDFQTSEIVGGVANFSTAGSRPTFNLTIPTGITPGQYRMRMITDNSNNFAPGASSNYPVYPTIPYCPTGTSTDMVYGDIRDYKVTIGNGACNGQPIGGITAANALVGCTSLTPGLFSVGATAGSGVSYQWYSSTTSPSSGFVPVPGATSTYYAPTISSGPTGSVTYYEVAVTCVVPSVGTYVTYSSNVQTITVNPPPSAITGSSQVCTGVSASLGSSPLGGTWTSSDNTVAVIGSASGSVTGVSPGIATITYAAPSTGCTITTVVTVNQNPGAITGNTGVCAGTTSTLTDPVGGGTWTSGFTGVATVGASSGVVTGNPGIVTPTTTSITYTLPTTCFTTTVVTVNPLPFRYVVTNTGTGYCAGTTSTIHLGLAGSTIGVAYKLYLAGTQVGDSIMGTALTLDFGVQSAPGVYSISGINEATGCVNTMVLTPTINVITPPHVYTTSFAISGAGAYCANSITPGFDIVTDGYQVGYNYTLYLNGIATPVTPSPGGSGGLDFGVQDSAGTYTVIASTPTTPSCSTSLLGSPTIIINQPPQLHNVTSDASGGGYCAGAAGSPVKLDRSATGVYYSLVTGGTIIDTLIGTGDSLNFGDQTYPGMYIVTAVNITTGCADTMSGSVLIHTNPVPNTYSLSSSGTGHYCMGGTGVTLNMSGSDAGTAYQLYKAGTAVGTPAAGTGSGISFTGIASPGTYTAVATNGSGCTASMTGSAAVVIDSLPVVQTVTGGGNFCSGGVGRHIGLLSSVVGVSYQLYIAGTTPVGAPLVSTGGPLDFGVDTTTGVYTAIATNAAGCTANMAGVATVATNPLPTPSLVLGTGNYCAGTAGLDVSLDFSATGVSYSLIKDGSSTGTTLAGTNAPLDFGTQPNGTYTIVATNTSTGCVNGMTGSAVIGINPLPTNYLFTATGSTHYCAGGAGVPVNLSGSSSGISYQLYNGITSVGVPAGGTGSGIAFGAQTATGTYVVVATDNTTGCSRAMPGSVTVIVNPVPNNYFITGGGLYCSGGTGIHVGLNSSNSGISYQLYNSGSPVGTAIMGTGLPLDFGSQTSAGGYTAVATNPTTGCITNMTGSATVATSPAPTAYTTTGGGTYCSGGSGEDVSLSGSDYGITYQLYRSGVSVGGAASGTGSSIDFGSHTSVGVYTIVGTDATTGCTSTMASSAIVNIAPLPPVSSISGGGTYCSGSTSTSHVYVDGTTTGVNYQLYNGSGPVGTAVAGTGGSIDFGTFPAGVYSVEGTNGSGCSADMTGTATIIVNPLPNAHVVIGGGGYCSGGTGVTVGLNTSDAGTKYSLMMSGSSVGLPVNGTGSTISFGTYTSAGTYTVMATNVATSCATTMDSFATISIEPLPSAYSITGGGNYCATGLGVHVGLSASDAGINYQLYKGTTVTGLVAPGTGGSIDFGLETAPGSYTVTAVNATTGCTSRMTGSSIISILPVVLPHVVLTSSSTSGIVCAGSNISLNASPVNGGSAPTYQWFVNGVSVGVGSAYSYIPNNGDVVTALMTSNQQCAIPDTGSASLSLTVSEMEMPSVTVAANPGNVVCLGSPATFSASTMYGGSAPVLRWIKNGVFTAMGNTYTYVPANGDIITFMLGSNYPCLLMDTVYSSGITMDVTPGTIPVVSISANPGTQVSAGESVTFTASATGAGALPAYQWSVNHRAISGATNRTYTTNDLADGDSVMCAVTGSCDLVGFNALHVSVSGATGVAQVAGTGMDVKLIPNPNKGDFTLKGNVGDVTGEVAIEVTNMLGQVVYKGTANAQNGAIDQHIQLIGNLANGMYLLNLNTGAGNTVFHFVVEK
jgi:Glycine rich protein/GEVED domain/Secretion system C-terminal sorting domain